LRYAECIFMRTLIAAPPPAARLHEELALSGG